MDWAEAVPKRIAVRIGVRALICTIHLRKENVTIKYYLIINDCKLKQVWVVYGPGAAMGQSIGLPWWPWARPKPGAA
jgi:hypothetical protein